MTRCALQRVPARSSPMPKTFFITTAIDYTNSAPHIGHAYEKVLADVIARYQRLKGEKVFFLTGVDQHGQKVQQSAEKQGVPPEQFVAGVTEQFIALWDKLDVRYDERYAGTPIYDQQWVPAAVEFKSPVVNAQADTQLVRLRMENPRNLDAGLHVQVKLPPGITAGAETPAAATAAP